MLQHASPLIASQQVPAQSTQAFDVLLKGLLDNLFLLTLLEGYPVAQAVFGRPASSLADVLPRLFSLQTALW